MTAERQRAVYHFELAYAVGQLSDEKLARATADAIIASFPDSPFGLHAAGYALERFDHDRSIAAYRAAIRRAAEGPPEAGKSITTRSLSGIARVQIYHGETDEALGTYREALGREPDDASLRQELAFVLRGLGDGMEATALVREGLARQPGNALLHRTLGCFLFATKDLDEAIVEFEAAVAANPRSDWTWAALVFTKIHAGRTKDALASAKRGVSHNPRSAYAHMALAAAELMTKNFTAAAAVSRHALELGPTIIHDFPAPHEWLSDSPIDVKEFEQALALMSIADPRFPEGHVFVGIARRAGNKPKRAIAAFEQALALDATCEWGNYNLGLALLETGNHARAVAAFRRAIQKSPGYDWNWFHLGLALEGTGDDLGAVEAYRKALTLSPDLLAARRLLADAFVRCGDLDQARSELRSLAARVPKDPGRWCDLAEFLAGPDAETRPGDWSEGLVAAQRAVDLTNRGSGEPLRMLAWGLLRTGDLTKAVETLDEALRCKDCKASLTADLQADLRRFTSPDSRPASSQPTTR
jgi:tetratricopeptide (TPR) repeat protein